MIKGKIIDIVKYLMPHGYMLSRNRNNFLRDYDRWKAEGGQVSFDTECRFDSFVSIDGFGSSGSSAVMDLLREYDCCTVWATKPSFTDSTEEIHSMGEMNLMRSIGGLLHIEKMMEEDAIVNVYWADAAIKDFMGLVYYSELYRHHEELHPLFFHFFEEITEQRLQSDENLLSPYVNPYTAITDIFYLKRMGKEEYHLLCKEFLYTLFNRLFPEAKGGCLVLDHIFDDCGTDTRRFQPFLPGVKRIKVRRDIRGVYVDAVRHDYRWLAHDSIGDFIKWERNMYAGHEDENDDYLTIKFEKLVTGYNEEVARIEQYLGIDKEQHTKRQQLFNPEISRRNIKVWEREDALAADCREIKEQAPDLCYM
ncbi:MAG: hypothetical protein IJ782_05705 [Prevotella sp.]|nr:hypothetical protein [Prevotella sp.]